MNTAATKRRPPEGLCATAKGFWLDTDEEIDFESTHSYSILDVAAWSLHRMVQAQEILSREGVVTQDAKGKPIPHPAISIERDSAIRFMRAVRELNLDAAPEESRPPAVGKVFVSRRK